MKSAISILFVPTHITQANRGQVESLYSLLKGATYDTIVFAERRADEPVKKLPMPSVSEFQTLKGSVLVNDALRNDFCDEDDDFYIDDAAYGPDMAIYEHLPLIQDVLSGFSVVSVPICDSDPAIVREFAYVMSEIMGGRNALLVIASELLVSEQAHWERIGEHISSKSISNVFNMVNSGAFEMAGSEVFVGGLLVAEAWGLDIDFHSGGKPGESLNCGLAHATGF